MTDRSTLNEIPINEVIEHPMGGKKNIVFDSQILSTLMGCPQLTDFRFNMNLQSMGGKSNSLEVGSIVHKVFETYYKMRINSMSRDMAIQHGLAAGEMYVQGCKHCTSFIASEAQLKPICGHQVDEYPGIQNTPPDNTTEPNRTGWRWALATCEQYFNFYKSDHWVPLEVEVVKGKVLYEDDEIRILWKAKIDLVSDTNQGIYPVDHKTMKQRRDTLSLNVQFMGQCLLMGTRLTMINKVGFQTTLKPEEKFTRFPMSYSADRLLEFQGTTLPYYAYQLIQFAESGYWPHNYDHCETKYGKCAFISVCESNRNMREEEIKRLFVVGPAWNPTNVEED